MALIVEDGTIVANAETYATAAQLVTFAAEYGHTVPATESEQEVLLRKAMHEMEGRRWKGDRVSSDQALPWPRTDVYVDRVLLSSSEIPRQLLYGQLNLAVEANAVDLLPRTEANAKGPVVENTVHGAVSQKYANTGRVMHTPASAKADVLLKQLERRSGLTSVTRA